MNVKSKVCFVSGNFILLRNIRKSIYILYFLISNSEKNRDSSNVYRLTDGYTEENRENRYNLGHTPTEYIQEAFTKVCR